RTPARERSVRRTGVAAVPRGRGRVRPAYRPGQPGVPCPVSPGACGPPRPPPPRCGGRPRRSREPCPCAARRVRLAASAGRRWPLPPAPWPCRPPPAPWPSSRPRCPSRPPAMSTPVRARQRRPARQRVPPNRSGAVPEVREASGVRERARRRSARMAVMAYDTSSLPDVSGLKVGILGGTGDQGRGLAYRLARAGHPVLVGSRNAVRGEAVATDLSTMPGVAAPVTGGENRWAAEGADLVIVAVPWDGHAATLADLRDPLAGKVVVDCVNPLGFDARGPYPVSVPEGSAAEQAAALLPDSRVCAAFHHVSAVLLADPA